MPKASSDVLATPLSMRHHARPILQVTHRHRMKKQRLEHHYPFPRERLVGFLMSRAFHEAKYPAMGRDDAEVLSAQRSDDVFEAVVRYPATADGPLPAFIKKLIGERVSLTQTDRWDCRALTGTINVTIKPGPGVRIDADVQLLDQGASTLLRMDWRVECRVPLIGGKVEDFLVGDLISKAATDERAAITAIRTALEIS